MSVEDKARSQARHTALARLIAAHRSEYDRYHREERVARGLEAEPQVLKVASLLRRIAELEAEASAPQDAGTAASD